MEGPEKEFNLLDEPWIRVMLPDCEVQEVSLTEALLHAHEYVDLASHTGCGNAPFAARCDACGVLSCRRNWYNSFCKNA